MSGIVFLYNYPLVITLITFENLVLVPPHIFMNDDYPLLFNESVNLWIRGNCSKEQKSTPLNNGNFHFVPNLSILALQSKNHDIPPTIYVIQKIKKYCWHFFSVDLSVVIYHLFFSQKTVPFQVPTSPELSERTRLWWRYTIAAMSLLFSFANLLLYVY